MSEHLELFRMDQKYPGLLYLLYIVIFNTTDLKVQTTYCKLHTTN